MNKLQPPDFHHLAAARGWLELFALEDAVRELEEERIRNRLKIAG